MVKSNNFLLVLTMVLLLISVIGTFTMLSKITFETTPAENPGVKNGEITFEIYPDPGSASGTGYMTLTIEAEEPE